MLVGHFRYGCFIPARLKLLCSFGLSLRSAGFAGKNKRFDPIGIFGQVDGLHTTAASLFPTADHLMPQSPDKLSVCNVILHRHNLTSLYLNLQNLEWGGCCKPAGRGPAA